jgi:hypothetical protein
VWWKLVGVGRRREFLGGDNLFGEGWWVAVGVTVVSNNPIPGERAAPNAPPPPPLGA